MSFANDYNKSVSGDPIYDIPPENAIKILLIAVFAVVAIKCAWVCDDAYITFRTVDNFARGHGLTWNVGERVQGYTHPLWMFTMTLFYLFTRDVFFTSIILSLVFSTAAVAVLAFGVAESITGAVVGVTTLLLSKAFVDYSTSGLENPLTHLLLAMFFYVYFKRPQSRPRFFLLFLIAAFGMLNRLDTTLLYIAPLGYTFFQHTASLRTRIKSAAIGLTPIIAWEIFSVIYYGFPTPNTAVKLNTGIPARDMMEQGIYYFMNSLDWDPVALPFMVFAIGAAFFSKDAKRIAVSIGMLLYFAYIIKVGGDFMSGRFFTAPLFCAAAMISLNRFRFDHAFLVLMIILIPGLGNPLSPVYSNSDFGVYRMDQRGVADERAVYYHFTGLFASKRGEHPPNYQWVDEGKKLRADAEEKGKLFIVSGNIGFTGFYAGSKAHIVDGIGLTDAFIARLPAVTEGWRIGHVGRNIPEGYMETLAEGKNKITNSDYAEFYEKLSIIIKGDIFSFRRFVEIIKMNLGMYNHLVAKK